MTLTLRLGKHKRLGLRFVATHGWHGALTLVDVSAQASFRGDHSPEAFASFTLLNVVLAEFHFYDVRHG